MPKTKLVILIYLWLFCLPLYCIEATVTLDNGEKFQGTLDARLLHFKDIFSGKRMKIRLKQIYNVKLMHESLAQNLEWSTKKEIIVKRYILMITTREGKRFWGRLRWRLSLEKKNKKRFFVFPTKQIRKQRRQNYYATNLVINDKNIHVSTKQFPSVSGELSLELRKEMLNIFAMHYRLGVFFRGGLTKSGFAFYDILPGRYDFILVSRKGLIFSLTKPKRQKILDSAVDEYQYGRNLAKWVEGHGNFEVRYQVMFYTGHLSDTRVLIMKKGKKEVKYLLWICKYSKNRQKWDIQNQAELYSQPMNQAIIPRLFFDVKTRGIFVKAGKKQWDYFIE